MERVILHCDCNCFFASVELLSHPDLVHLPVAVCGDPNERHGIILAKNEPAKRLGIQTAETIWKARQKCPDLILLEPHYHLYEEYSRKINAIYNEYTDLVEPFGIDESWLDVTGTLHLFGGDAKALADRIRDRIRETFGLTISVGVSFNKVFAKLGSDYKKPDATTVISRENWKEIVEPLPMGDMLFVGHAVSSALAKYGLYTIGDLANCSEEMMETLFGKNGLQILRYARGEDDAPVIGEQDREEVKSVGNSTTFRKDLTSWEQVQSGIALLCDSVAMRLRHAGLYCGGVRIAIKNSRFQTVSKQKLLPHHTHLMKEIERAAMELMHEAWHDHDPIRLLSVTATHLSHHLETGGQLSLFAAEEQMDEKQERVENAMEHIRKKYGGSAISYSGNQKSLGSVPKGLNFDGEKEK